MVLVAFLARVAPALAQPAVQPGLRLPITIWAGAVAADQVTTYRFTSEYRDALREQNPLIRGLDTRPAALVAAGVAIDAATGWAAYKFLGKGHPRLATLAFYGAAAYRGYLAFYNVQAMRRAQAARTAAP